MNINYEINEIILLSNDFVVFQSEDKSKKFNFKLPTLKEIYTNEELIFLIGFLEKDIEEIKKWINLEIETHYDFIHLTASLTNVNEDFKKISNDLISGLKCLIPDLKFDKVLRANEIIITNKVFNKIIKVLFKSLDKEKIVIEEDDDEFTKKEKEMKLKVQRIKGNSKKSGISIDKILMSILYTFPQYRIDELMNMNIYTIYFLFKNVGKIANYEVSKIAAGNGLTKKHKFFIE